MVAAAAASVEEHHCLWNQLPLLSPPERLLNAPPVAALEEVGEVATVLEATNRTPHNNIQYSGHNKQDDQSNQSSEESLK